MSIGGTSFNLGLNVPAFKQQFQDARAVAQAGSQEIGRVLNQITSDAEKNAQQVNNAITRALGRGGALSKWQDVRDAANQAQAAMQEFASGNTERGLDRITNAAQGLDKILERINTKTLAATSSGVTSPAIEASLKYYAAQATTLRNALDSINSNVNQSGNRLNAATQKELDDQRRQDEIAIDAIRKQTLEYVKAAEAQIDEDRRQDQIAQNAIRNQNLAYIKAQENQELTIRKEQEALIAAERSEMEKRLADQRRLFVRQLREEERLAQAPVGPSRVGQLGGALATGLGIGSGAQVAATAIAQIQNVLQQLKEGAIDFNDALDQSTIAWTTFTGSAEKAKIQVKELFDFAKVTPFTFGEVDAAARLLAAFGGAAFASKENLTLLGNVAAGTKQPLNNIAYEFGQIYTEIENGLPFGRAARALVQFGALTGETRVRLEEMQKAGVDVNLMLDLLYKDLGRFGGQLEAQSKTFSGGLTTAKDSLQALEAIALRPAFEGLKELLHEFNALMNNPGATSFAQNIQGFLYSIGDIFALAKDGGQFVLTSISGVIVLADVAITKLQYMADQLRSSLPGGGGISAEKLAADKASMDQANTAYDRLLQERDRIMIQAEKDRIRFTTRAWSDGGQQAGKAYAEGWQDALKVTLAGIRDDVMISSQFAGLAASRSFVAGFSKENFSQLKDLSDVVANAIFGSKSSGKLKGDAEKLIADVRPLLVQAISDINQYGRVADSTFSADGNLNDYTANVSKLHDTLGALKSALPPDAFAAVQEYLRSIEALGDIQTKAAFATAHLANEEKNLTDVQARTATTTALATAALDAANAVATRNARIFEQQVTAIKDAIDKQRAFAQSTANDWDDAIKKLNRDLKGLRENADENAKKFSAMLEPLQKEQERLATVAKQNQDIYNAVLKGTTQEYLDQNTILDEQTRKIADKWEAEIGGKRRALEGANGKVDTLEKQERAAVLALDERIRDARRNHNAAQVAALEAEKKRLQERYKYQIDIEQERAAVAADQFEDASKGLTKEQAQQEAIDKKKQQANQAEIDSITAQAKAQKELDDAAIAAKQKEIDQTQELADASKAANDIIIAGLEEQQRDIEKRARTQKAEDDKRIQDAATHLANIKAQGDADVEYAKKRVEAAKDVAEKVNQELKDQKDITETIKDRLQFIQQENDAYLQRINAWRANAGLPPLTWDQILAGNYPQGGDGGARGVGEGRQDPTAAASGAPTSTPTNSAPNGTGPQRLRYIPNIPTGSTTGSTISTENVSTLNTGKMVTIGNLHLFSNANITKEVDVDNAAIRAGQIFLKELRSENLAGGDFALGELG